MPFGVVYLALAIESKVRNERVDSAVLSDRHDRSQTDICIGCRSGIHETGNDCQWISLIQVSGIEACLTSLAMYLHIRKAKLNM